MSLLQPRSPEYDALWRPPIPLLEQRSGGHCFGGRSSTEGLLVDGGPMRAVSVEDGVALDISPWGGAYDRVAPDATAFPHRAERFLIKHDYAVEPGEAGAAREWLARSWEIAHPYGTGGAYVNFPDADLDEWDVAYHGPNRERLLRVKAEYDPDDAFGPYPDR